VIRNGRIVDGTGAASFVGDISIKDGVITAVGEHLEVTGVREVDAAGKLVAPGWVDIHTHLDGQVSWDASLEPFTSNGVTTVVMGNCGVGFAPCRKEDRGFLMELMEGVEDIPLGSLEMGIQWKWETFSDFLDYLESIPLGCDVAAMIGHGPVRAYVMGERANLSDRPGGPVDNPVTAEDIARMAEIVKESVQAGAIGFSTSRTLLHRDKSGVLVPGTLAGEEELLAMGKAISDGGGGIFEMASDFMSYDDKEHTDENHGIRLEHFAREWVWMNKMSKRFNVPLCFCLGIPTQTTPQQNGFRTMLQETEASRKDGCDISVQVFVRPQCVVMCWDSKSHPFVEAPTFIKLRREAAQANVKEINKDKLADPSVKASILQEVDELLKSHIDNSHFGIALPQSTDTDEDLLAGNLNGALTGSGALAKMMVDGAQWIHPWDETSEPPLETSAKAVAERTGKKPLEVIYDWLCMAGGKQVVSYYFMNYSKSSLDDTFEMLTHDAAIPGLGDAGAHGGFLVDSTSHSYLLTHWVRDKKTGPKLTIEQAVKLHSYDTAERFGLHDRGCLKAGKKADVNIIDFQNLTIHRPQLVYDLPKGASRWIQRVSGYDMTICNGVISHEFDRPTGKLAGKLVRNPRTFKREKEDTGLRERISMMLSTLKWEAKATVIKALVKVLGPKTLEDIGFKLNESKMSHVANL